MSDRVHYFSNNDEAGAWMAYWCDRCRHDPDTCEAMIDMLFGNPSERVTRNDDAGFLGRVTCHDWTDATPTPTETLVEWAAVDREPAPKPPVVLDGQGEMFGGAS